MEVPSEWRAEPSAEAKRPDAEGLATWWDAFDDPVLVSLIERAIQGNIDLRGARARIQEARARRGVAAADRFPTLTVGASQSVSRSSAAGGTARTSDYYTLGFDASWEADLFGGIAASISAAEWEVRASVEDLRDVLVSLIAEVALNYVEVRSFQARLRIVAANLAAQQETYDLVSVRYEAGLVDRLDVEQAKSNLESTQSQIPTLQTSLTNAKNRLSTLLGETPGSVEEALATEEPVPAGPVEIAVGVPADALRRRPDVRRAESLVAAQMAQYEAASADRYPNLTLTGSIGLEALSMGGLFSIANLARAIGASLGWRVFDAGRIRQNIKVQAAVREQTLNQYESAILTALQEVEDALTAYANEQIRREPLVKAVESAQNRVDLSQNLYSAGQVGFLDVLDAQRSLLSLQDELAQSQAEITSNLIRLYKALGGGWTPLSPSPEVSDKTGGSER